MHRVTQNRNSPQLQHQNQKDQAPCRAPSDPSLESQNQVGCQPKETKFRHTNKLLETNQHILIIHPQTIGKGNNRETQK